MYIFSLFKDFLLLFSSPEGSEINFTENLWTQKILAILYSVYHVITSTSLGLENIYLVIAKSSYPKYIFTNPFKRTLVSDRNFALEFIVFQYSFQIYIWKWVHYLTVYKIHNVYNLLLNEIYNQLYIWPTKRMCWWILSFLFSFCIICMGSLLVLSSLCFWSKNLRICFS